jgi:hypothetical protein
MPTALILAAAVACLGLAVFATRDPWSRTRTRRPPSDAARWTLGLRGWRTWRDGLEKSYQCASRRDAQEFICELALAIDSVDELSRLRSRVRGRVVRIHIRAPAARLASADAHFTARLDQLGRPAFCAPLLGPVNRV